MHTIHLCLKLVIQWTHHTCRCTINLWNQVIIKISNAALHSGSIIANEVYPSYDYFWLKILNTSTLLKMCSCSSVIPSFCQSWSKFLQVTRQQLIRSPIVCFHFLEFDIDGNIVCFLFYWFMSCSIIVNTSCYMLTAFQY